MFDIYMQMHCNNWLIGGQNTANVWDTVYLYLNLRCDISVM